MATPPEALAHIGSIGMILDPGHRPWTSLEGLSASAL